ncbi:hypothetical protein K470DRAFT_292066 [Piedraia hortae CBS 480.64]|uniref:Signal recognition particle receptor subunit beta n=1 Tax=Piedraia hortae CBS 480.64 TaxID=1314780 RepID=A0A6A7CA37_9PEZI|nr:hypothetical protein K470DRAFT_292066 [Piedraia hortae CBS 480.64]
MADFRALITWSLSGSLASFLLPLLLVILLPPLIHFLLYYTRTRSSSPSGTHILLLGPSGAGKTALLVRLAGESGETRTSITGNKIETSLGGEGRNTTSDTKEENNTKGEGAYRSINDPLSPTKTKVIVEDTPGHPKLRPLALNSLAKATTNIIFVVDSSHPASPSTAEFLYQILDSLLRRGAKARVCILANKQDLFTALPVQRVGEVLEEGVQRVVQGRVASRALEFEGENEGWDASRGFSFEGLGEDGVLVEVRGCEAMSEGGVRGVREWALEGRGG